MTWQKERVDGSTRQFNFIAPNDVESQDVLFPTATIAVPEVELDELEAPFLAVDVLQMDTFVQPEVIEADLTLNLAIAPQVTPGARLHLKLEADATVGGQDVTLGDGFDADFAAITVGASSVVFMSFVYDGTAFMPLHNYVAPAPD